MFKEETWVQFRELPPVKEQLMKCVRCGRCRTVCPVFYEIKKESAAPRGHVFMVQMLRDGEVAPSPEILARLTNCMLCETCSTFCPSGIDIHELNAAARSYLAEKNPSRGRNLVFDTVWTRPRLLKTGTKAAAVTQRLGLQKAARALKLTRILPGDLSKAEKIMDSLPLNHARGQLPIVNRPLGEIRYRVAYFLGCGTDMFTPQVALATVKVLTTMGCEVIVPKEIKCCGQPHIANGKIDTAVKLTEHNIRLLGSLDVDYIITDCASCASAWGEKNLHFLLEGTPVLADGLNISKKFMDVTSFLVDVIGIDRELLQPIQDIKVTYHDPCHLAKALNIRKQPRELLKTIPGVTLVEMHDPDRCCGGSGTFSMTHYDLSMKVLEHKMDNIENTGADVVATCCPSCSMQLAYGLRFRNYQAVVRHPIELLANALKSQY